MLYYCIRKVLEQFCFVKQQHVIIWSCSSLSRLTGYICGGNWESKRGPGVNILADTWVASTEHLDEWIEGLGEVNCCKAGSNLYARAVALESNVKAKGLYGIHKGPTHSMVISYCWHFVPTIMWLGVDKSSSWGHTMHCMRLQKLWELHLRLHWPLLSCYYPWQYNLKKTGQVWLVRKDSNKRSSP